jgi:hypothetical protein
MLRPKAEAHHAISLWMFEIEMVLIMQNENPAIPGRNQFVQTLALLTVEN